MNRMQEEKLRRMMDLIGEPDAEASGRCRARWDGIAKPLDGLGELENCIVKIAGMRGTDDVCLDRKAVAVMCGDSAVVREGVAQTSSAVTASVAASVAAGTSTVNVMARRTGASVFAIDVGMASPVVPEGVVPLRVADGADNIAAGPAMTREQAAQGILAGMKTAMDLFSDGYDILAAGEMGIGNTTPAAAVTSVLTGQSPETVTGRGAGLSEQAYEQKIGIVRKSLALNAPDPEDPLDILSKVGSYEIAGMTGLFLGGAAAGGPVVADGAVSLTAAVLALRLNPNSAGYMLLSHEGKEPACRYLIRETGMKALLKADLSLGEGTGALLLFPLLDIALELYNHGRTFSELGIEAYKRYT